MQPEPHPKADLPPPRKPPGRATLVGAGGGDEPDWKRDTVRIALPPKPTATPAVSRAKS